MCRDWRKYSSDLLNVKLASVDWDFGIENVQDFWNVFENKLIKIIDELVPLTQFDGNIVKDKIPKLIKNKIILNLIPNSNSTMFHNEWI